MYESARTLRLHQGAKEWRHERITIGGACLQHLKLSLQKGERNNRLESHPEQQKGSFHRTFMHNDRVTREGFCRRGPLTATGGGREKRRTHKREKRPTLREGDGENWRASKVEVEKREERDRWSE
eukprot:133789-Pleurochrysis_carterae.AAC.1